MNLIFFFQILLAIVFASPSPISDDDYYGSYYYDEGLTVEEAILPEYPEYADLAPAAPENSGSLILQDADSFTVCSIIWTVSPILQTFNVAHGFQGCNGTKSGTTATKMEISTAAEGTIISVNGLPLISPNGYATTTLTLDVTKAIELSSPVPIQTLDGKAIYGSGAVNATYYKIGQNGEGDINKRVSTVTISVK